MLDDSARNIHRDIGGDHDGRREDGYVALCPTEQNHIGCSLRVELRPNVLEFGGGDVFGFAVSMCEPMSERCQLVESGAHLWINQAKTDCKVELVLDRSPGESLNGLFKQGGELALEQILEDAK